MHQKHATNHYHCATLKHYYDTLSDATIVSPAYHHRITNTLNKIIIIIMTNYHNIQC